MSYLTKTCQVCGHTDRYGVVATSALLPTTFFYCRACLEASAEPRHEGLLVTDDFITYDNETDRYVTMVTNAPVTYTYKEDKEERVLKTRSELSTLIDEKVGDTLPKEAIVSMETLKEFSESPDAPRPC